MSFHENSLMYALFIKESKSKKINAKYLKITIYEFRYTFYKLSEYIKKFAKR